MEEQKIFEKFAFVVSPETVNKRKENAFLFLFQRPQVRCLGNDLYLMKRTCKHLRTCLRWTLAVAYLANPMLQVTMSVKVQEKKLPSK